MAWGGRSSGRGRLRKPARRRRRPRQRDVDGPGIPLGPGRWFGGLCTGGATIHPGCGLRRRPERRSPSRSPDPRGSGTRLPHRHRPGAGDHRTPRDGPAAPGSGEHGVILDLLFASSGIESEVVEQATVIEVFPGIELPVARVSELLALKILARDDELRPQDTIDIRALLQEATDSDLEATGTALALIVERGYHRKRDLLQDFEDLTKRFLS